MLYVLFFSKLFCKFKLENEINLGFQSVVCAIVELPEFPMSN